MFLHVHRYFHHHPQENKHASLSAEKGAPSDRSPGLAWRLLQKVTPGARPGQPGNASLGCGPGKRMGRGRLEGQGAGDSQGPGRGDGRWLEGPAWPQGLDTAAPPPGRAGPQRPPHSFLPQLPSVALGTKPDKTQKPGPGTDHVQSKTGGPPHFWDPGFPLQGRQPPSWRPSRTGVPPSPREPGPEVTARPPSLQLPQWPQADAITPASRLQRGRHPGASPPPWATLCPERTKQVGPHTGGQLQAGLRGAETGSEALLPPDPLGSTTVGPQSKGHSCPPPLKPAPSSARNIWR